MILASIESTDPRFKRDGELVVVSSSRSGLAKLPHERRTTLRDAIDDWSRIEPELREIQVSLDAGRWNDVVDAHTARYRAPLSRTWAFLDGSAFVQHVVLVRKARGAEPPEDLLKIPLMYQGASDNLLGPNDSVPLLDPAHGMDFEAEVGVITDYVPAGTKAADAKQHVKLVMLINDVSLRELIPREFATGFGFFHGKPPSSFSPFTVTPDELGDAFRDGRVHLPLTTTLNGTVFGAPNAGEMFFSFYDLIEHAAKTRPLSAGSIVGSGTVSNKDSSVGSSCIVERRMIEKIESGTIVTPYLKDGDRVRIEMLRDGRSLFGAIDQMVRQQ